MLLGPTDLIPGLFALAALFGCVQLLRYAARTVQHFPVLGLAASVAVLGWMHQHRAALPGAGADAPSGMLAQAGPIGGERRALGVHVSDEDMPADYAYHNQRYQRDVAAAFARFGQRRGL